MIDSPPRFIKLTCIRKYHEGDEENTLYIQISRILWIEDKPAVPDRCDGIEEAHTQIDCGDDNYIAVRESADKIAEMIMASETQA